MTFRVKLLQLNLNLRRLFPCSFIIVGVSAAIIVADATRRLHWPFRSLRFWTYGASFQRQDPAQFERIRWPPWRVVDLTRQFADLVLLPGKRVMLFDLPVQHVVVTDHQPSQRSPRSR